MAQELGVLSLYDSGKSSEQSSFLLSLLGLLFFLPRILVLALLALSFVGVSFLSYLAILFAAKLPRSMFEWHTKIAGWIWHVGFYDLEEYIYRGWLNVDWGADLELYNGNKHSGRRFPAGPWIIDFLACDKATNDFVVLHLKRDNTSDATVGRLLRHMGWVRENVAGAHQNVRGIIVTKSVDADLEYAVKDLNQIEVKTYSIDFQLVLKSTKASKFVPPAVDVSEDTGETATSASDISGGENSNQLSEDSIILPY